MIRLSVKALVYDFGFEFQLVMCTFNYAPLACIFSYIPLQNHVLYDCVQYNCFVTIVISIKI